MTPLFDAIDVGSLELVSTLLAHGANVNATTTKTKITPLMWAIGEGQPDLAKLLIDAKADVQAVTTDGFSALTFAARAGDVNTAKLLVAAGLSVNETGVGRVHALPYAALAGQDAFAMFLPSRAPTQRRSPASPRCMPPPAMLPVLADWQRERSGGVGPAGVSVLGGVAARTTPLDRHCWLKARA
jgi:hypothetical protein